MNMNYGKKKALSTKSASTVPVSPAKMASSGMSMSVASPGSVACEKSRNLSEKRRRDQFNMLINELCLMVSVNNRKMDKTSVLKSTISFLKAQKEIAQQSRAHEIEENWKPSFLTNDEFSQLVLESMNSFLLVLTQGGMILYTSESVTSLLNYLPAGLINRSIYDFTHASDRMKLYNLLSNHHVVTSSDNTPDYEKEENQLMFTCHLKRCQTGEDQETAYELVQVRGNFRQWNSDTKSVVSDDGFGRTMEGGLAPEVCFYCTVRIKYALLIRELPSFDDSPKEFMSRHSLEWKFLFLDHRGPPVVGYLPYEVLGTSGYDYYHPDDLEKVAKCHEQLMQTGEGTSVCYRFLTKGQQWIWLQTRYYVTYNHWNSKPEFIVCTNVVVNYATVRAEMEKEHSQGDQTEASGSAWTSPSPSHCSDAPTSSSMGRRGFKRSDSETSSVVGTTEATLVKPKEMEMVGSRKRATPTSTISNPAGIKEQQLTQPFLDNSGNVDSTLLEIAPQNHGRLSVEDQQQQHAKQQLQPQQLQLQRPQSQQQPQHAAVFEPIPVSSSILQPQMCLLPAQVQLHQQLLNKHRELQEAIKRQQEQLHEISQQLMLTSQFPMSITPSGPGELTDPTILPDTTYAMPVVNMNPTDCISNMTHQLLAPAIPQQVMMPVQRVMTISVLEQPQQVSPVLMEQGDPSSRGMMGQHPQQHQQQQQHQHQLQQLQKQKQQHDQSQQQ